MQINPVSRSWKPFALAVALPLVLGACSSVPDWADPTEWFDDDAPPPERVEVPEDDAEAEDPNLADVPESGPDSMSAEEREALSQSLQADKENAQYSDEPLRPSDRQPGPGPADDSASQSGSASAGSSSDTMSTGTGATQTQATQSQATQTQTSQSQPAQSETAMATSGTAGQKQAFSSQRQATQSQRVAIIYFAHGSAALDGQDWEVLRQVTELYRQRGGRLRVTGHASSRTATMDQGSHNRANLQVSAKRADAVAGALRRLGVPGEAVYVEATSDTEKVYAEVMPTGEAGNRRAEIFLEY